MECDAGVSKLSIDELKEILEVWDRGIIRRRESNIYNFKENEDEIRREGEEKLLEYVRRAMHTGYTEWCDSTVWLVLQQGGFLL